MEKYFLESEKLYFKKLEEEDVTSEYKYWMNDPEINIFMETRFFPHSTNDIKNFVNDISKDKNSVIFGIFDKKSSRHIGNIKIGPINWIHRKSDISLFIGDKNFLYKGYANESIKLIVYYGFNILNLHKLSAGIYDDNIGSKKAFEKNGFEIEGVKKEECFINNKWTDVIVLGKINDN